MGADSAPCSRQTAGLLHRRRIAIGSVTHIGKEANRLEDVEAGLIHDREEITTEYGDSKRELRTVLLPALRAIGVREVARRTGLARSSIRRILHRGQIPRDTSIRRLEEMVNCDSNSCDKTLDQSSK